MSHVTTPAARPNAGVVIRRATADDATAIRRIVYAARLNPTGLDWRRFLVAGVGDALGPVAGVGQIKPHYDGSHELASLAVTTAYRGQGIGAALIRTLLAGETGTVYLLCAGRLVGYYARFGFSRAEPHSLPPYFRRVYRLTQVAGVLAPRGWAGVAIMRRDATTNERSTMVLSTVREPGNRPDFRPYGIDSHWLTQDPARRTLLVVLAHPDDESFGNGGTLARYAAEGVAIHYACATRGECGTVDPALLAGGGGVGALRTQELLCAAGALGLAGVHFLGYRDSGMPHSPDNGHPEALVQAPLERVTGQVVALIRALRPQVVLTFAPYGGYGHPDHIHIHEATVPAFHAAGDPARYSEQLSAGLTPWTPAKLYFPTFGGALLRLSIVSTRLRGGNPRRFGENADINLVRALNRRTPVTTTIDSRRYLARKDAAWRCHRSQRGVQPQMLRAVPPLRRRLVGIERYTRAVPAWTGGPLEYDFFSDIGD